MTRLTVEERFWRRVTKTDGCWLWDKPGHWGYGRFWDGEREVRAHRFAYELLVGPIPDGLEIDHLCEVKLCVNPAHLEAVTSRVNTLRGGGIAAKHSLKTHCLRGHEFTDENTYIDTRGYRQCRECNRLRGLRGRARKVADPDPCPRCGRTDEAVRQVSETDDRRMCGSCYVDLGRAA